MAGIRLATLEDAPSIEILIEESVMALQSGDYTESQRRGALGTVLGLDRQLIRDGAYYVVETDAGIVACGGWSRRRTLFGSDDAPQKDDSWLDPATEAARIRAFFVHPGSARQGLGSRILDACEEAAAALGFRRLELVATLTGVSLYGARGFAEVERFEIPLPNGSGLPVVRMTKSLRGFDTMTP